MRKELRFERRLTPTTMIKQIRDIRKDVTMLKKRQEQILQILKEHELTEYAKESLKEARATSESEYIPHEDVKR